MGAAGAAVGRRIAALAGRQHGVVARTQLYALGLDRFAIRRRVAAGGLHPVHGGSVYSATLARLSPRGRYLAAVMACGSGAVLSHRSAADLYRIRPASGQVEVTVPHGRRGRAGIQVHRTRGLDARDVVSVDGIPVTTVPRTLIDLGAVVPSHNLPRALDRAERLGLFDLTAMNDALERANGKRGTTALKEAMATWEPSHTKSELEERFKRLVEDSNLPKPLLNAVVQGEQQAHEVDAYWPDHRLAVQLDGFEYHRTRRDRRHDADADTDLELAGLRVMRLTWAGVTTWPERTLRRLAARLADGRRY